MRLPPCFVPSLLGITDMPLDLDIRKVAEELHVENASYSAKRLLACALVEIENAYDKDPDRVIKSYGTELLEIFQHFAVRG